LPRKRGIAVIEPRPADQIAPAANLGEPMARTGKTRTRHIYSRGVPNQPAHKEGATWHSSRITVETGPSDRGQHAQAPRKNKEIGGAALRKAEREAAAAPPDEKQTTGQS